MSLFRVRGIASNKFNLEIIPTCEDYRRLLNALDCRTSAEYSEARMLYGSYTYRQWYELLKNK